MVCKTTENLGPVCTVENNNFEIRIRVNLKSFFDRHNEKDVDGE